MTNNNSLFLFSSLLPLVLSVVFVTSVEASTSPDRDPSVNSQPETCKKVEVKSADLTLADSSTTVSSSAVSQQQQSVQKTEPHTSLSGQYERLFEIQRSCRSYPGSLFFEIGEGWKY